MTKKIDYKKKCSVLEAKCKGLRENLICADEDMTKLEERVDMLESSQSKAIIEDREKKLIQAQIIIDKHEREAQAMEEKLAHLRYLEAEYPAKELVDEVRKLRESNSEDIKKWASERSEFQRKEKSLRAVIEVLL